ncbi:beta-phosphoglucomutase [Neobacillus sp. OS1-33]|jgi:beta-phosphoglucomutase|uniref:beta-phosphoglucomutase n=1 Tax=Neobacillus sp. OS1-33 TaxID=3070683 RepID=UPI0027E0751D|nr:beta-phosphoglucomutase [Neobacillus sp. OS1-33]WML27307.1 beta-phosphoglucomutase [Neobacillus sp. OS1-33]
MKISAVIFDLDGVIVSTDEYHYQAWKQISDQEKIYFDREINETLRGVSRMESLDIILSRSDRRYNDNEKQLLALQKNEIYCKLLNNLSPNNILPGVINLLLSLKARDIKVAIGSSSKNTPFILQQIGLTSNFDAIADGNSIKNSKPDPEVFLLAADMMGVTPTVCAVIEDAQAGIDAAKAAGMKAVGIGSASTCLNADLKLKDLTNLDIDQLLEVNETRS